MAIPEHSKCVTCHKRDRDANRNGNWRRVRQLRRKQGKLKPKARIRQIIDIQFEMEKSRIKKMHGVSYTDFMKAVIGKYYKKWGKYE